jgi:hypothetical protein
VTADTIKNCWNKVKIMPIPVVVAGGGTRDAVFDELRDLLVSMGEECDVMAFVDQPDGRWTEAPIESDEEDAELVSALKARSEQDVEEADDSLVVIPWTLSQARAASEGVKAFVHSNLEEHPELRKYMAHVEDLETLLENMTLISTIKANYATPGPAWLHFSASSCPAWVCGPSVIVNRRRIVNKGCLTEVFTISDGAL